MNELKVSLKNCYGISKLNFTFKFGSYKSYCVYASNGSMKTSFAKTFFQLQTLKDPEELIYNLTPEWEVLVDQQPIKSENIFVIKSFVEGYENGNMSTLLVSEKYKKEYDSYNELIKKDIHSLIVMLNRYSGVKKEDLESKLISDLNFDSKSSFISVLESIDLSKISEQFSVIKYSDIFNSEVIKLLNSPDVIDSIEEYVKKYEELLNANSYFNKEFTPVNASNIAKVVKSDGFFNASHTINLHGNPNPIYSSQMLEDEILKEKNKVMSDEKLKSIETKILSGVKSIKEFQIILLNNPLLINELKELNSLKKKLWLSYLKKEEEKVKALLNNYLQSRNELMRIEAIAEEEQTIWDDAIKEFNRRFTIPFTVSIKNRRSSVLGTETPNIVFSFTDLQTNKTIELKRKELDGMEVLSQGEKRALYLLNIIFEILYRKKQQIDTVFVIDDIADSFDYKNKYAIVEYLIDIFDEPCFYQIILTHNFDFFRTLHSKLNKGWENYLIANVVDGDVELESIKTKGIISPFENWKSNCHTDKSKYISLVPFVRNIIEYTTGTGDSDYLKLTAILHVIQNTSLSVGDVSAIFNKYLSTQIIAPFDSSEMFKDVIFQQADIIVSSQQRDIDLEKKVVLSIAIRLKAEDYMWSKISDQSAVPTGTTQTYELFKRFKNEFGNVPLSSDTVRKLREVILMTPENIHLNSFMYEPILDMSVKHLYCLYNEVKILI